jgi:hypothetical protein
MVMLGTHKSLIIVMLSEHFAGLPGWGYDQHGHLLRVETLVLKSLFFHHIHNKLFYASATAFLIKLLSDLLTAKYLLRRPGFPNMTQVASISWISKSKEKSKKCFSTHHLRITFDLQMIRGSILFTEFWQGLFSRNQVAFGAVLKCGDEME